MGSLSSRRSCKRKKRRHTGRGKEFGRNTGEKYTSGNGQHEELKPLPIPDFNEQNFIKVPLDSGDGAAIDLRGHQVQVIVKIGSIQLTPEKPTFDGGKWHVEVSTLSFSSPDAGDLIWYTLRVWLMSESSPPSSTITIRRTLPGTN